MQYPITHLEGDKSPFIVRVGIWGGGSCGKETTRGGEYGEFFGGFGGRGGSARV